MEERGRGRDGAGGGLREKKGGGLGCGGVGPGGGRQQCLQQMRIARALRRGGEGRSGVGVCIERWWKGGREESRGEGEEGTVGGEVKKDTKARRKSLNDKRSGQLGLGRQGPKGAAG